MGDTTPFKRSGIFEAAHLLYLAQIAFQAQQYEKVRDLCLEILKSAKHDPEAMFLLGLAHYYMQEHEEAIPYFLDLLEDVPDYPEVHYFLGKSYKLTEKNEQALHHLKLAMIYDPKNRKVPYCLYTLHFDLNELDLAKKYLLRTMVMAPLEKKMWLDLSILLKKNNCFIEAQDILNRMELLGSGPFKRPESNAYYSLGDYLFLSHNFDLANGIFQKIVMSEVNDEASLCYLAHIAFQKNNIQRGYDLLSGIEAIQRQSNVNYAGDIRKFFWCGETLRDKKLFIHKGRFLHIEILASHCVSDILTETEDLVIEASESFAPILKYNFPKAKVYVENANSVRPKADYEISSVELLRLLRPESDACTNSLPSLKVPPQTLEFWQKKLQGVTKGFKIGIDSGLQQKRSHTKACMNPANHVPSYGDWLNINPKSGQVALDLGGDLFELKQLPEKPQDMSAIAAILSNLDLIITGNVMVANLAGALNLPCWVATHNMDWFYYGDKKHPFYKSLRIFSKGYYESWADVIDNINKELKKL